MTTIVDLAGSIDQNSKDYDIFLQDLLLTGSDIPFNTQEINSVQNVIISTINTRINQANTRYDGLCLMSQILPKCTKDTLLKYGMLWITKATQVIENCNSSQQELTLACKVIGCLIPLCKDIPDLHKQISMQNVKILVNALANIEGQRLCGAIYYLVANLLHYYPEVCERLQTTIRKIILLQVDSEDEQLVIGSAKCFALLSKAIGRSFKPPTGKSYYSSWTYNQAIICNSLHYIMNELFTDLIELESVDVWYTLELPNISNVNIIQFYKTQKRRFMNLCIYLCTMLRGCTVVNLVLPDDILRVLCRGLAITPQNLKTRNSFKEQILYLILPQLHISLLKILDALITGFKQELIPYGSKILQLFQQTLEWTENATEYQTTISGNKPFKGIRIFVYKCLSSWLSYTGYSSGAETLAHECLPLILKDATTEREKIMLTVQKTQNLSKRAQKRLRDSQYEKSTSLGTATPASKDPSLDADLCKEALVLLQNIFFNCSSLLKQSFYKNVQNTFVPILYDFYLNSPAESFYKYDSQCRLQLLKTLKSLQLNPHGSTPPPTQFCIEIFEMALNDSEIFIINEAKLALAELEKVVHPIAKTLKLPIHEEVESDHNSTEDYFMDTDTRNVSSSECIVENNSHLSNKRPKIINTEKKGRHEDERITPTTKNVGSSGNSEDRSEISRNNKAAAVELNIADEIRHENDVEIPKNFKKNNEDNVQCKLDLEVGKLADLTLEKDSVPSKEEKCANKPMSPLISQDVEMVEENTMPQTTKEQTSQDLGADELEQQHIMELFHDEPKNVN